jgi:hypothetical protein
MKPQYFGFNGRIALLVILVISTLNVDARAMSIPFSRAIAGSSQITKVDFNQDWARNPSPDDLVEHFATMFPGLNLTSVSKNCLGITDANRGLLGVDDPYSGAPLQRKPSEAFVPWYTDCTKQVILANIAALTGPLPPRLPSEDDATYRYALSPFIARAKTFTDAGFGPTCQASTGFKFDSTDVESTRNLLAACSWRSLSPGLKISIAKYWVKYLIGPDDVITDLGLGVSADDLARRLVEGVDEFDKNPKDDWNFLGIQKAQLPVISAIEMIQFLVSMTEAFQY